MTITSTHSNCSQECALPYGPHAILKDSQFHRINIQLKAMDDHQLTTFLTNKAPLSRALFHKLDSSPGQLIHRAKTPNALVVCEGEP